MSVFEPPASGALPIIDLGAATSDQVLLPGQKGVINFSAAISIPLHVACGDGQIYKMFFDCQPPSAATGNLSLTPNNSHATADIYFLENYANNGASTGAGNYWKAMLLTPSHIKAGVEATFFTSTTHKHWVSISHASNFTSTEYASVITGFWNDATTAWTSLGTLNYNGAAFTAAITGQIVIERII